MKRSMSVVLAAALLAVFTSLASAGDSTPRVDRREARQQHRVAKGIESGQLTPAEARRLEAGQAHVDRMENRAKSDGKVTASERRRLNRAQNRQSRRIHRLKHNRRTG